MIVEIESLEYKQVRLPDFFIVGAARSGTSSLFYYLRQHPDVFIPSIKEPHFFCFMDSSPSFLKRVMDLTEYINLFDKAKQGQIIGDASAGYLYYHEETIKNIKDVYGPKYKNLNIIIILRNPAERAWSHYMLSVMDKCEDLPFEKAISSETIKSRLDNNKSPITFDYVGYGMYYEQVKSYIEEFPNVKIWLLEDLSDKTQEVIKETFLFLGVDVSFKPNIVRMNVSGEVKFKKLHETVFVKRGLWKDLLKMVIPANMRFRIKHKILGTLVSRKEIPRNCKKKLIGIYSADIVKLQKLIGRDLSSWLRL